MRRWITCPKPNPQARLRLFCFSYSGGGASMFRTWSNELPLDIEVCPVQLPGREERLREPPFTRLVPLVQTVAHVLRPYLDVPFVFFGHSMGALICFEVARELRKQYSLIPIHLFVSSYRAPQIPDPDPPIYQCPEAEFVEEVSRRYDGIPEEVLQSAELMELVLPILRADFTICDTYVYSREDPLDCPISAFGGLEDHRVSREDLAAWRDQTRSSFSLQMLPGKHFLPQSAKVLLLQAVSQNLTRLLRRRTEVNGRDSS